METEAAEWVRDHATKPVIGSLPDKTPQREENGHAGAIIEGRMKRRG
jgi:succinyl-CoA synthetase alpha subunit